MSIARLVSLGALLVEIAAGCKQSSDVAQLAPAAPAPQPATAQVAANVVKKQTTVAPVQTTIKPLGAQSSQPPEGMVCVPGGSFDMGPPREVTVGKAPERTQVAPFFLDRTEVTVAAYLACVQAKACTASQHEAGCNGSAKKPLLQHPVNCITKAQAEKYCAAQGKRLPTAAEWEFAARGTDGRTYPWGNDDAGEQLCWQGRAGASSKKTCPVGSFPAGASPFGALDMAGNVAEWTSTPETETEAEGAFRTRGGGYRSNRSTSARRRR